MNNKIILFAFLGFIPTLVGIVGCGTMNTPSSSSSNFTANYTDSFLGFMIYQPSGWQVKSSMGTITVKEDSNGTTAAFIYPVTTVATTSARTILEIYSTIINDILIIESKGSYAISDISESSILQASATLSGTIFGTSIEGRVFCTKSENINRAPAVYKAYWYPTSLSTDSKQSIVTALQAVLDSYSYKGGWGLRRKSETATTPYTATWSWGEAGGFQKSVLQGNDITMVDPNSWDQTSTSFSKMIKMNFNKDVPAGYTSKMYMSWWITNEFMPATYEVVMENTDPFVISGEAMSYDRYAVVLNLYWKNRSTKLTGMFQTITFPGAYGVGGNYSWAIIAPADEYESLWPLLTTIKCSIVVGNISFDTYNSYFGRGDGFNSLLESYKYRQDVYDKANKAWDDYIRYGEGNIRVKDTSGNEFDVPKGNYSNLDGGYKLPKDDSYISQYGDPGILKP